MAEILTSTAPIPKHPSEDLDIIADFSRILAAYGGGTLTAISGNDPNGVALGLTISPSGQLAAANVQINTDAEVVNGKIVKVGKGVKCSLTGGNTGVDYTLTFLGRTSTGQTRALVGTVQVSTT